MSTDETHGNSQIKANTSVIYYQRPWRDDVLGATEKAQTPTRVRPQTSGAMSGNSHVRGADGGSSPQY